MKRTLFNQDIDKELLWLLKRALIADGAVLVLCLIIMGMSIKPLMGLLLGTSASAANMLLLAFSTIHSVDRGSEKRAKRFMFTFYLIRLTVMGAALALGFNSGLFDNVCTFLPLLYPKLFYSLKGIGEHIDFKNQNLSASTKRRGK